MSNDAMSGSEREDAAPAPGTVRWAPRKARPGKISQTGSDLGRSIVAGLIAGCLVIMLTASHAALIFSPQQPELFAIGFQMALTSSILLNIFYAVFSSLRGSIALSQDVTSVSISVLLASIIAVLPAGLADTARLSTLLAAVMIATFATGLFFFIMGKMKLGRLIRFTPIPVIGGFLAATGWLLLRAGFGLALPDLSLNSLPSVLTDTTGLLKLAAALAVAAAVIFAIWRSANVLAVPLVALAAMVIFSAVCWIIGVPYDALVDAGWVVRMNEAQSLLPAVTKIDPAGIQWWFVMQQSPLIFAVLTVGTIALLMNASALELSLECDVDLDRELTAAGAGNIFAGMIGGIPGYIGFSPTVLNHRLGGNSRICGLVVALLAASVLVYGSSVLQFIPLPVLGGLLMWLGVTLLYDWLYRAWHRVSLAEYLIMLAIVLVVVFIGMLEGVFAGLVAGVTLFVVDYSRIEVIKTQLTGRHFNSRREMPEAWRQAMRQHGAAIVILKLQGFIFFGTAHQLVERIRNRLERSDLPRVRYLVMDFRHTSGLDSSSVLSFIRLERIAKEARFKVVLTNLSEDNYLTLKRGGLADDEMTQVRVFDDLDRGLQWCEDKLIGRLAPEVAEISSVSVHEKLVDADVDTPMARTMLSYMERIEVEPGTVLIQQGATSNEMFFIESGRYAVLIDRGNGDPLRVSTFLPGAVAGEVAFYMDRGRSASVVCEEAGAVWRFDREGLERMRQNDPQAAYFFQERMASMLAERLIGTTRLVQHLAD